MGTNAVRKIKFVLLARQEKNILYQQEEPNELTQEGPLSSVAL
jgi:hypothetical protein